jgi:hypothetical protein
MISTGMLPAVPCKDCSGTGRLMNANKADKHPLLQTLSAAWSILGALASFQLVCPFLMLVALI